MSYQTLTLTVESVHAAREWFARNAYACIAEAASGRVRVNDFNKYVAWRAGQIDAALAGEIDDSFAFWQRAYYIQTGECPSFLPK